MKKLLNLPDIINLEYFLYHDQKQSPTELHIRDRNIQIARQQGGEESRQEQLAGWVSARLDKEFRSDTMRSPGTLFGDALRVAKIFAVVKGIVVGIVTGITFFAYSGTTPINVLQFLLLFVASQIVLALLLSFALCCRKFLPKFHFPDFYVLVVERSFSLFIRWIQQKWNGGFSVETINAARHAFALAKIHNGRYGTFFYWSIFSIGQIFTLAFNVALLLVMFLKIVTSDLAFGWQSTINCSDATIHGIVKMLALPWSWVMGSAASYPSLEVITGSRIVLKDSISALVVTDLTGWWPFLVMCLLVYGVLVRVFFLGFGLLAKRWVQQEMPFDSPQIEALLRRMSTPLVSTQAEEEDKQEPDISSPDTSPIIVSDTKAKEVPEPGEYLELAKNLAPPGDISKSPESSSNGTLSGRIVLIGVDLFEPLSSNDSANRLSTILQTSGWRAITMKSIQADYDEDQQLLPHLASDWPAAEGILIIVEGWMVPLIGFLSYLADIRQHITTGMPIGVGLVGRPDTTVLTPVTERDFTIWRRKVEALADPYLYLFPLIGMEAEV